MPMLSMAKLINTWRHSERATPVNYFPLCFINFNKSHTLTLYVCDIFHYPSLLSCHLLFCIFCFLPTHLSTVHLFLSFCILLVSFSHLIQGGLAHREVFDPQSTLIGLQLVKDVSHPSRSNRYMVLYHTGVLVLFIGEERTGRGLKGSKWVLSIALSIL